LEGVVVRPASFRSGRFTDMMPIQARCPATYELLIELDECLRGGALVCSERLSVGGQEGFAFRVVAGERYAVESTSPSGKDKGSLEGS
jgi:hypothetical protein